MRQAGWLQVSVGLVGAVLLALGGCGQFLAPHELDVLLSPPNVVPGLLFFAGIALFLAGLVRLVQAGVKAVFVIFSFVFLVFVLVTGGTHFLWLVPAEGQLLDMPPFLFIVAGIAMIVYSYRRKVG